MQKTFNSVGIVIVWVLLYGLALSVEELQDQREEDRQLINGLGMAVIQLIEKENNNTY